LEDASVTPCPARGVELSDASCPSLQHNTQNNTLHKQLPLCLYKPLTYSEFLSNYSIITMAPLKVGDSFPDGVKFE
jgi:hypothetical protein